MIRSAHSKINMEAEFYRTYKHNPPHLFKPHAKYMVTGSTYQKRDFLVNNEAKERLVHSILKGCSKYAWDLEDWVILNNHFHIMLNAPESASSLANFMNEVYKFTALWLKKNNKEVASEKRIFYNYWDTCITYEKSYFTRLNYIYYNPVKHGYVVSSENYYWGSFYHKFKSDSGYFRGLKDSYPFDKVNVYDDF